MLLAENDVERKSYKLPVIAKNKLIDTLLGWNTLWLEAKELSS